MELVDKTLKSLREYLYHYDRETLYSGRDQRFKCRPAKSVHYVTDQTFAALGVP